MTDYLALALAQNEEREELAVAEELAPAASYPGSRRDLRGAEVPERLSSGPALPGQAADAAPRAGAFGETLVNREAEDAEKERAEEAVRASALPGEWESAPVAVAGKGTAGQLLPWGEQTAVRVPQRDGLSTAGGAAEGPLPVSGVRTTGQALRPEETGMAQALSALDASLGHAAVRPREGETAIIPRAHRESGGPSLPAGGAAAEDGASLPLLDQLRQAQRGSGFVQTQRRAFTVTLPEGESAAGAWSAEDFDLACERDARRYGGGFELY